MTYEGIVSRNLNRRLTLPLAKAVPPLPANMLVAASFIFSLATAAVIAAGLSVAGGIGILLASALSDFVEDARRLNAGAGHLAEVLGAIAEVYGEAAILAGMTVFAARFEGLPRPEVIGVLVLGGALTLGYSHARIQASLAKRVQALPADRVFGIASRDVRLLIAGIGTIAGQCYWTLAVLAALSAATIAWRLLYLRSAASGQS